MIFFKEQVNNCIIRTLDDNFKFKEKKLENIATEKCLKFENFKEH